MKIIYLKPPFVFSMLSKVLVFNNNFSLGLHEYTLSF